MVGRGTWAGRGRRERGAGGGANNNRLQIIIIIVIIIIIIMVKHGCRLAVYIINAYTVQPHVFVCFCFSFFFFCFLLSIIRVGVARESQTYTAHRLWLTACGSHVLIIIKETVDPFPRLLILFLFCGSGNLLWSCCTRQTRDGIGNFIRSRLWL